MEFIKAIYDKFVASAVDSDVTQTGELTHGVYYDEAPEEAMMPFVVFHLISSAPRHTFNDRFEELLVQFSIFDDSPGPSDIGLIRDHLVDAFDRASLDYTTKSAIGCIQESETGPVRLEDCWMATVDMRIMYK